MSKRKKPAAPVLTVQCPLFHEAIGKTQCQEQCSIIRTNERTCDARACASPWRFCLHCLLQGYRGPDSIVTDHIHGACEFHLEHGGAANRNTPSTLKMPNRRESAEPVAGQVLTIPTARIRPLADQPRRYFDKEELAALERSIMKRGQLQPGLVRKIKGDPKHEFELIDGQRRWHACTKVGVPYRAIVVQPTDDEDQFEMSIASNFQRAEHTPMEVSAAIDRLSKRGGRTMDEIAVLFGKSSYWVLSLRAAHQVISRIPETCRTQRAGLQAHCTDCGLRARACADVRAAGGARHGH